MITKKELEETINKLNEKFNYIAQELESLWQLTNSKAISSGDVEIRHIANRIEDLQFNECANPSQFASKYRFNNFFEVIEENEKIKEAEKNIDKLLEYERIMKSIQKLSQQIDKINLENKN